MIAKASIDRPDIRDAAPGDIVAVTAIYRRAVLHDTGTFEVDPPDAGEMATRHARVSAGGYPFLVASFGERVAGFAYASVYRDRPAYRFTLEDSVYVDEGARGQGVGKALLGALIERSARAGFRQMIAVIGDSNNEGSIRLHQSLGFKPTGCLASSGWKFGRWLDVVLMQCALGQGDTIDPPE